ncbi:KATNB1-like protein 1 [Kryptolebias marmoratus]|uniref:Katanin regulatory subunit B1 like 1 n=1 Tax=Kryptolebias marmoratus TaxID=37003 RepID=A0A3Q2ZBV6_KRYMA|nr:KATNB1-like protein 1 [Kryptolebias marmoratus]XP_017272307.1 KATNB1-like protein 1 [Kryptolebias marmoratus]
MDSSSENGKGIHSEAAQYRVSYAHRRNAKQVEYDKHEEFNKKRYPVSRSGNNNPGRLKRVVSCKRKTHHLTVVRRKQLRSGRNLDATNKENEMKHLQDAQQDIFFMDPQEFPLNVSHYNNTSESGSEQTDFFTLYELSKDHNTMTDVLFGRNLRLKVALTLWKRNFGELLTYFLKIQDTGVLVDFLPLICKCIDEDSTRINIGCCVDLFPLVRQVLSKPYEEYQIIGFKWIHSVLKNWWEELQMSGFSGSALPQQDKNFQVFNHQLWELWKQDPLLKSVPAVAGEMANVIGSFLFQLK